MSIPDDDDVAGSTGDESGRPEDESPPDEGALEQLQDFLRRLKHGNAGSPHKRGFSTEGAFTPVRFGRFVIESRIGEGGQGVVYRARDTGPLQRHVAIKVLHSSLLADEEFRSRFESEARHAAQLRHEHIVPVYEFGQARFQHLGPEGRHATVEPTGELQTYIAYELVEHRATEAGVLNLARRLEEMVHQKTGTPSEGVRPRRRDLERIVEGLAHVALAVAYAHERSVIHRDLSPSNILIDERDRWCITDFGLSGTALAIGAPLYTSPEQAAQDGRTIGPASDLYSLGVILYEILACQRPFSGSFEEVLEKHRTQLPIPPSQIADGVPRDLELLCLAALQKNPASRPASALAFAELLQNWLAGLPSPLRGSAPMYRLWLWCRRNVQATVGIVIVASVLSVATMISQWQSQENRRLAVAENRAAGEANAARSLAETERIEREIQSSEINVSTGQWRAALELQERLLGDPWLPKERHDELRLRRVRSKIALNELAGLNEELASLDSRDLAPSLAARCRFERAIYELHRAAAQSVAGLGQFTPTLSRSESDALELLQRLQDDPNLELPDKLTAAGLAADSALAGIAAFENAMRIEPFHPYAGSYCLNYLTLFGRFREAEVLARTWLRARPRDPVPIVNLAVVCAFSQKFEEAAALLSRLKEPEEFDRPIPSETLVVGRNMVNLIQLLNDEFPNLAIDGAAFPRIVWNLMELQWPLVAAQEGRDAGLFIAPASPRQREAVGRFVSAFRTGVLPVVGNPRQALADMEGAEAFIAPGTVRFARAIVAIRAIPGKEPEQSKAKDEIAALLAPVFDEPMLFEVRGVVWMMLAIRSRSLSDTPSVDSMERERLRIQARIYLIKAAQVPHNAPAVHAKIEEIAAKFRDREFQAEIKSMLDGSQ